MEARSDGKMKKFYEVERGEDNSDEKFCETKFTKTSTRIMYNEFTKKSFLISF